MFRIILPLLVAAGTSAAPHDSIVYRLKEQVVTGTRRPETLLSAPAAITVVDRAAFSESRNISLKDALGFVPGVFTQSRSGSQDVRVTIRGYGARGSGERSNVGNMRGIRVLTDGIPVTEPDGRTSLDLVDLGSADKVEISRSNVSALYGNASGGVINLRSDFSFDSPYFEATERGGAYGYHREQGRAGFLMGSTRSILTVSNSTFGGWRAHSGGSVAQGHARFSTPIDDKSNLGILLDGVTSINRFPGAITQAQLDSAPEQANPKFLGRDERRNNQVGRAAVTLDRALNGQNDLSAAVYVEPKVLRRSERNRFRDFNRYHVGGNASYQWRTQVSEGTESRLTTGIDEAWQDGSIQFYNLTPTGGRGTDLKANKREGANSAGVFVQEEIKMAQWSVRGALRYDDMDYVFEDFQDPTLSAVKHFNRITPKGAISYQAGDHTIYAALGGGVESPAFNEIDPPPPFDAQTGLNPFLDPMISTTLELGARGQLVREGGMGQINYDVAMYLIDVKNDIVPFDGGSYFQTAGKSRRKGAELGLEWKPVSPLMVQGALTLSRNEYLNYKNDLGDFGGKDVAGLPSSTYSLKARYEWLEGLSTEVSVEGAGSYFADDANSAAAPSYNLVNASLGYTRPVGSSAIQLYLSGNNLTDKKHVASVFINGVGGEFFEPGLPRNMSAGLSFKWQ